MHVPCGRARVGTLSSLSEGRWIETNKARADTVTPDELVARARALVPALLERGHTVHALSRRRLEAQPSDGNAARFFEWDGVHPPDASLHGVDAVVHLAGEPIFGGLATPRRMERMVASRVESTRRQGGASSGCNCVEREPIETSASLSRGAAAYRCRVRRRSTS